MTTTSPVNTSSPTTARSARANAPGRARTTRTGTDRLHAADRRYNRVRVLLAHVPRYSIRGQARLAADVGVARSTVSRLVNGRTVPSAALARDVTAALSRRLGGPLDQRDVFSPSGAYLTPSGCGLCSCSGCLPPDAWGADDVLRPEWRDQRPGDWSLARPLAEADGTSRVKGTKSGKGEK